MQSAKKVVVNFRWERFKLIIKHAVLKIKHAFQAIFSANNQTVKGRNKNYNVKKGNKVKGHKKG